MNTDRIGCLEGWGSVLHLTPSSGKFLDLIPSSGKVLDLADPSRPSLDTSKHKTVIRVGFPTTFCVVHAGIKPV